MEKKFEKKCSVAVGRLTRDAKELVTEKGKKYLMTLAVNRGTKDNEQTDYYEFSIKSEKLAKYMTKGKLLAVAYTGIYEKTTEKDGKQYKHQYLNDVDVTFVPERKLEEKAAPKTAQIVTRETETEEDVPW